MAFNLSYTITNALTMDEVVNAVNGVDYSGDYSSEQLAAHYALHCIEDSDYNDDYSDNAIEAHLEVLTNSGAKFDTFQASLHAQELIQKEGL